MNTSVVKSALSSIGKGLGKASSKVAENQQGAKSDDSTSYTPPAAPAPKMHTGGTVSEDGTYRMKAGEHVLTAPEKALAIKHALMFSGMKSLAKAGSTAKKGTPQTSMTIEAAPKSTTTDKTLASPKKPGMPSASITPSPKAGPGWRAQSAITKPGDTTRPTASDISKT